MRYLTPPMFVLLSLPLLGPFVACMSGLIVACALACVHLSHMPLAWEAAEERAQRVATLEYVSTIALGLATLCWLAWAIVGNK